MIILISSNFSKIVNTIKRVRLKLSKDKYIQIRISEEDKSKINFIWRGLEYLEKVGIIVLSKNCGNGKSKQYYLPKEMINIEKITGGAVLS